MDLRRQGYEGEYGAIMSGVYSGRPGSWKLKAYQICALCCSAFTKIALISTEREKKQDKATTLKKQMETLHFVFLVLLQTKVLESVNAMSKLLQAKDVEIQQSASLLKTIQVLSAY